MPNVILKCQIGLFHSLKNAGCLAFLLWFLELQCSSTTSSLCYPCFELPLSLMRRLQVSHTYPKLGQVSVKVKIITSKPYLSIVCLNNLILILASLNRAVVYMIALFSRESPGLKRLTSAIYFTFPPTALAHPNASLLGGHTTSHEPEYLGPLQGIFFMPQV